MAKIEHPDSSAHYYLDYLDSQPGSVDIFVHKSVAPTPADFNLEGINGQSRAHFEVPGTFILPTPDRGWGFGEILTEHEGPTPGWIRLICALPSYNDRGTDWERIYNTVGTLRFLFDSFRSPKKVSKADVPQLLLADIGQSRPEETRWPVGAEVRPAMSRWLEEVLKNGQEQGIEQEIASSMHSAYSVIIEKPKNPQDFTASAIAPHMIRLEIEGVTTAMLNPDGDMPDKSFELVAHNITRPQLQLAFFAGLSRLSGLAAARIYHGDNVASLPSGR
ncbi:MAG: hypothetical protein HY344_01660 [Candidatus Levybacteria bacterium]|nr:hypothetical protein [Candidatus Levybacteria bacterium]